MSKETLFTIDLKNLDSPFEREKLESLPKKMLAELLIQHIKRTFEAIEYTKALQEKYFRMGVWGSNSDLIDLLEILKGAE